MPYGLHKQTRGCRSVVEPGATSRVCLQPWAALPRAGRHHPLAHSPLPTSTTRVVAVPLFEKVHSTQTPATGIADGRVDSPFSKGKPSPDPPAWHAARGTPLPLPARFSYAFHTITHACPMWGRPMIRCRVERLCACTVALGRHRGQRRVPALLRKSCRRACTTCAHRGTCSASTLGVSA